MELNIKIPARKKLNQVIRFGAVGITGLVIDFLVTWFCKEPLGLNKYLSNIAGFSIAVLNNYMINRYWTFRSKQVQIAKQFVVFFLVSLAGLVLNTAILYLFHHGLQLDFYFAKCLATIIVFGWNYIANSKFTFKD